jgi:hypothetical protein
MNSFAVFRHFSARDPRKDRQNQHLLSDFVYKAKTALLALYLPERERKSDAGENLKGVAS